MNVLVRLLRNPSFASYVTERQPTLAGLVQVLRTQPEVARSFGIGEFLDGSQLGTELEADPADWASPLCLPPGQFVARTALLHLAIRYRDVLY